MSSHGAIEDTRVLAGNQNRLFLPNVSTKTRHRKLPLKDRIISSRSKKIRSRKAIRRHLGLPLSSSNQSPIIDNQNVPNELRVMVHKASEQPKTSYSSKLKCFDVIPTVSEKQSNTNILPKQENEWHFFKSEGNIRLKFDEFPDPEEPIFLSDTNLMMAKSKPNYNLERNAKILKSKKRFSLCKIDTFLPSSKFVTNRAQSLDPIHQNVYSIIEVRKLSNTWV